MPEHDILPDRHVVIDASRLNYTWYNTHNITVAFTGNIGNEMFQFAALYGISKANGLKPIIPDNLQIVKMFPYLKATVVSNPQPGLHMDKFRELKSMAFDMRTFSLNFMKNINLLGYLQSWRYFDHVRKDVLQQFTFPQKAVDQVQLVFREALSGSVKDFFKGDVQKHPPQFVGIHVRRGDLLLDESIKKGYVTVGESYINVAMDYFINKYKHIIFIVCSDDMVWTKKHVKMRGDNPVIFSPFDHNYPAMDLCLLSKCNHTIMTVGTFGWWAAWLAGGETVYYKKFPKPWTAISEEFRGTDYFLPQWYGI